MDRLSGLDASFLYFESGSMLMHVCGLFVLDQSTMPEEYEFTRLRDRLHERVGGNPVFRRKLHSPVLNLDHPVWIEDDEFDIEHHVHRAIVPTPGTREQVAAVCSEIAAQQLDRNRPLWEMWVLEGLEDGSIAVMTKMHHATVDGVSGASLVSELCSLEPDAPPLTAGKPKPAPPRRPSDTRIVVDGAFRLATRPVKFARLMPSTLGSVTGWIERARRGRAMPAPFTAPRTSFNGTVTGHRSVAYVRMNLADVKEVKNASAAR